mgnify:CR=1 FL=1
MTLRYKVKLLHSNGYAGIQDSVGKVFNASCMTGLYYIHTDSIDSHFVPDDCYMVFDRNAVEVLSVETVKEGLKRKRQ